MKQILFIRETIIKYFKRYEIIILFTLKFLLGVSIFTVINNIGYPIDLFNIVVEPAYVFPYILLMSILFSVLPVTLSYGLIILNIGIQVSSSIGVATFVMIFLLCILFFYIRLAPKESILILAVFFGYYFKIPYLVPIIAGLYFSLTSIIPITIGIIIWDFIPLFSTLLKQTNENNIAIIDIPSTIMELYSIIYNSAKANEAWIYTAFIFAVVVFVVYAISHISIDYSKEMAICSGAIVCIFSFVIATMALGVDVEIAEIVIFSIISAALAIVIKFFDIVLDYSRVERVQFEDEQNYYYVKIIPKVSLTRLPTRTKEKPIVRKSIRKSKKKDFKQVTEADFDIDFNFEE